MFVSLSRMSSKPSIELIENVSTTKPPTEIDEKIIQINQPDFSNINESKVLRKMDFHLLPMASLLYLVSFIDRGSIANVRIEGITVTLNITEDQFNLCVTIFFITYALFEVPSNIVLKKIGRPSVFVPTIMVIWGIVMTLSGIVQNFAGLFAARLFLGIAEAGLYPAASYWICMELQFRQALFYGSATTAGAFSGLLAFGIAKMDGIGNYEGWRWIFIIEGIATVIIAVISYFVLYDYPETAKFLSEREREFVIWRLKNDSNGEITDLSHPNYSHFGEREEPGLRHAVISVLKDYKLYLQALLFISITAPSYGITLFLPSVVKAMGYSTSKSQLLTIPVFIVAALCAIIQSKFADRVGIRFIFIAGNMSIVVIGFIMAIVGQETSKPNVIYGGVFIGVCALFSAFPGMITWNANNLANSQRKAIGMAFQIGFGNFGGVFASNFYKPTTLTLGHSLELGFSCLAIIVSLVLAWGYNYANVQDLKKLKNNTFEGLSDLEFYQMGDNSPFYKYRL
ncbi:putative membrane protein [Wickerhamomyces ciferrii]|uniref:Membrane protein n=1 Tax=Wickerhamomyces ciferrii (strain ATCC 14091 / BCRC 22168 / CBS 111 / JCM 3599 / NBRC 0793 / NRRL Y-1031 F-60-10) TaxID=1206466 RepID=K0KTM5_WICCF|nr:uncharacterized protein BN7_4954 [Wickerhamomyces ciferrii]CCH45372.1 putative membrane protein [Wickerhamomyces ciferrii]